MRAHIDGIGDFNVISASYDITQNEIGKIDFTILYADTDGADIGYRDIELVYGSYVFTGILIETTDPEPKDGKVLLPCHAYTDLGRLLCEKANSDGHYQNVLVSVIVQNLLSTTTNWLLTDTSTMIDPNDLTTIDLRSSKENLFSQVAEVIKSVPSLTIRYLGYNGGTGNHEVGIGNFGARRWYCIQNENLVDIKPSTVQRKPLWKIEAISDKSGNERVTLQSLVSPPYAPYTSHPDAVDYPVVLDGAKYVVKDNSMTRGCSIVKNYSIHKTKNDSEPTTPEVTETAFAVWRQAIRDLQKNRPHHSFNVTGVFDEVPLVSDMMYVHAVVEEKIYDPVARTEIILRTFNVDDWYRIVGVKCNFEDNANGRLKFEVSVSDEDYAETSDPDVEMYDMLVRHDTADKNSVGTGNGIKGVTEVTVTHDPATDPADGACTGTAKKYSFPFGALPAGTTGVFAFVTVVSPVAAIVQRVTEPVVPSTPLELCVQIPGGGWSGATPVSVKINYVFY